MSLRRAQVSAERGRCFDLGIALLELRSGRGLDRHCSTGLDGFIDCFDASHQKLDMFLLCVCQPRSHAAVHKERCCF